MTITGHIVTGIGGKGMTTGQGSQPGMSKIYQANKRTGKYDCRPKATQTNRTTMGIAVLFVYRKLKPDLVFTETLMIHSIVPDRYPITPAVPPRPGI